MKPLILLISSLVSLAATDDFSAPEFHKPFANPTDDPALPRVLLIGETLEQLFPRAGVVQN